LILTLHWLYEKITHFWKTNKKELEKDLREKNMLRRADVIKIADITYCRRESGVFVS